MHRLLMLFVFLLMIFNESVCWGDDMVMKTYKSPFYNYQVSLPDGWVIRDGKSVLQLQYCYLKTKSDYVFKNPDKSVVQVTVVVRDRSEFEYMDFSKLKEYRKTKCKSCRVWGEGATSINGMTAEYYIYSEPAGYKGHIKTYRILTETTAYDLSYVAPAKKFDEYLPIAEKIIASFEAFPIEKGISP